MFGFTDEDFKSGLNVIDMLVPEDRDRAKERLKLALTKHIALSGEYTALRKDGTTFPILINSSPIIKNKRVKGLRGFVIDISERKKVENELKKLSRAVEQSPVSIVITDTLGNISLGFK